MNRIQKLSVAAGFALLAAGCGNVNQKSLPEPVTNHYLTRQIVFTEPDGFRNVSFGCNGIVGIYVTSRGAYKTSGTDIASLPSSIAVIANDPNCS